MERKQYLDQIKDLVQTVQTLLDTNIALGNEQKNYRQRQIVRLPVRRLRLTSLLENCKPVGVRCMARTMRSKLGQVGKHRQGADGIYEDRQRLDRQQLL